MVPAGLTQVIGHFQQILAGDGGKLDLVALTDDVMQLRYQPGHNEACADCVLSPEDLKELIEEAARRHTPAIRVELTP